MKESAPSRGRLTFVSASLWLSACAQLPIPPEGPPTCWRVYAPGGAATPSVQWTAPSDPEHATRAKAWCAAIGPALVLSPISAAKTPSEPPVADSLLFVTWNTHVGEGALNRLIGDLRAGRLTDGTPVEHLVLLLQEVPRVGGEVPSELPEWARVASRIDLGDPGDQAITETARAQDLHLFYAPAMSNGDVRTGDPPGDRGNAILSTVPLEDLQVIELPLTRQRRIAVVADITGVRSDGTPWRVNVATAHLENHKKGLAMLWSWGGFRARQARALVATLAPDSLAVLGGDFNTWSGEDEEEAVEVVRAEYPLPLQLQTENTYAWVFGDRQVDYLVFRADSTAVDRNRLIPDEYGSDHRALMGWLRLGPS